MARETLALVVGHERVGDLIAVGDHLVLYTARADLAGIDGRRYDSAYDAEIAVRALLRGGGRRAQHTDLAVDGD